MSFFYPPLSLSRSLSFTLVQLQVDFVSKKNFGYRCLADAVALGLEVGEFGGYNRASLAVIMARRRPVPSQNYNIGPHL